MRRKTVFASPALDAQWRWYLRLPAAARPNHPKTGTGRLVAGKGATLMAPTGALAEWIKQHCPGVFDQDGALAHGWPSGMFR